jgi:spermidine synthase
LIPLLAAGLLAMAYLPVLGTECPRLWALTINMAAFFAACMVCHGELARLKPHPSQLTAYYLMLAVGGALGGIFVGVVAPYCFNANYELSVGIVLTAVIGAMAVIGGHGFRDPRRRSWAWAATSALVAALCAIRIQDHIDEAEDAKIAMRDFYGTLRVFNEGEGADAIRTMTHGQTIHGRQYSSLSRQEQPTTYYTVEGGAGRALIALRERGPLRVGVVGLGVGTLASYGRRGDYYRMYDINPLVIALAQKHFTFLSRSRARIETVLGDARLRLESEVPQNFDLLVVDAFSGDAVPIHLLTREAFAAYFKHLKPDCILAIHITNRYLNLEPVVKSIAESFGRQARRVQTESEKARQVFKSTWMLVTNDASLWEHPLLKNASSDVEVPTDFRPWRDDYSSIFAVLR